MAHAVLARRRQGHALLGHFLSEIGIGNLNQNARPIAHQRIGANRAPMVEIAKNEQALADDLVGFAALDMGDKTNAAGVVFVSGIVEALGGDHDAWQ